MNTVLSACVVVLLAINCVRCFTVFHQLAKDAWDVTVKHVGSQQDHVTITPKAGSVYFSFDGFMGIDYLAVSGILPMPIVVQRTGNFVMIADEFRYEWKIYTTNYGFVVPRGSGVYIDNINVHAGITGSTAGFYSVRYCERYVTDACGVGRDNDSGGAQSSKRARYTYTGARRSPIPMPPPPESPPPESPPPASPPRPAGTEVYAEEFKHFGLYGVSFFYDGTGLSLGDTCIRVGTSDRVVEQESVHPLLLTVSGTKGKAVKRKVNV